MPRRTAEDAARTRDDIVSSARQHFATAGFHSSTTAAIAADAGVSQSALFHHFPDKRALFEAVLHQVVAAYDAQVREAAFAESTPLAMVLAGCRRSLELACDPEWTRIVVVDAPSALDEVSLRSVDAAIGRDTTRFALDALAELGIIDPATDIDALTTVIYGTLTEAAFDLARDPSAADPDRVVAMVERVLTAFATPAPV